MKKLKLLILTAAMSCLTISSICQSSPTTITEATLIPNTKLKDAAKLIEKGKTDAARVILLNEKIDFLNQRIALKDSIIKSHDGKDDAQQKVIETYQIEVDNLVLQRDIAVAEMKQQNKQYSRQKRKTVFAALAAAGITTALFLFLK